MCIDMTKAYVRELAYCVRVMKKFYTDYIIWQEVYGLLAIFDIISFRLICNIFCLQKIIYKMN